MNQEASTPGGEPSGQPIAPRRKSKGLPPWLPFFALAVVPALIVGIAVAALSDKGPGGGAGTSGVIDGFIRFGNASQRNVTSFQGEAPANFPSEFPVYKGEKVLVSFSFLGGQNKSVSYFVIYTTSDLPDQVYAFYLDRLTKDPWQVEVARASREFTGVQFSRPDDADVQGDVSIHRSDLDKRTAIYVSFQDLTPPRDSVTADEPFVLSNSRPLPPNFPNDIPIYKGKKGDSVVTDTYFERAPGSTSYIVSFLTKDSQDDVITSYRGEFQKRGWSVTDSQTQTRGFTLGIDFTDGTRQQVQGTIRADAFSDDPSYAKVDLLLQVSTSRGRGN